MPLAGGFEGGDDLADAVVEVFDEGDELGALGGDVGFAVGDFFQPVGGWLDGGVGGVVGEVEKERLRRSFSVKFQVFSLKFCSGLRPGS